MAQGGIPYGARTAPYGDRMTRRGPETKGRAGRGSSALSGKIALQERNKTSRYENNREEIFQI